MAGAKDKDNGYNFALQPSTVSEVQPSTEFRLAQQWYSSTKIAGTMMSTHGGDESEAGKHTIMVEMSLGCST